MVDRRKTVRKKSEGLKDGAINDLKKQVKKVNEVKKELMEDMESLLNDKDELEQKI